MVLGPRTSWSGTRRRSGNGDIGPFVLVNNVILLVICRPS
jgi:hypothetical protein